MKTGLIAAQPPQTSAALIIAFVLAVFLTTGCTHVARTRDKTSTQLEEHSRAFTSGIMDVLHLQPTERRDPFTEVALQLAQEDQRIEGLPLEPIDVGTLAGLTDTNLSPAEAVAQKSAARERLSERIGEARSLLGKQRRAEDRLIGFGERFEQARNEQRVRWFKRGTTLTLILGGLAALIVFVPASVPVLGRILAFCVARFPALAGTAGVVSVKAFDAVVKAIERARSVPPAAPQFGNQVPIEPEFGDLPFHLSTEMDAAHKALVRQRKAALKLH